MSDNDLKRNPHKIRGSKGEAWWYEESTGISIVQEFWSGKDFIGVRVSKISWTHIRRALARKDKP